GDEQAGGQRPCGFDADSSADYCRKGNPWREPADLLRAAGELRHTRRTGYAACEAAVAARGGAGVLRRTNDRDGAGRPGDDVYGVGFWKDAYVEQRWDGSWMGEPSLRGGRVGSGSGYVWDVSGSGRESDG